MFETYLRHHDVDQVDDPEFSMVHDLVNELPPVTLVPSAYVSDTNVAPSVDGTVMLAQIVELPLTLTVVPLALASFQYSSYEPLAVGATIGTEKVYDEPGATDDDRHWLLWLVDR